MNEEERFDELLSSKLSEREFPFNDVNWDEAERLITEQERWSKISRISLIFSAGLVAGMVIMLPFMLNSHSAFSGKVVGSSVNQTPVSPNTISVPVNQPQEKITNNIQNNDKASLTVQSAFVKKNNSTRATSANLSPIAKIPKEPSLLFAKKEGMKTPFHHPANPDLTVYAGKINKPSGYTQKNSISQTANATPSVTANNNQAKNSVPSNSATKEDKNNPASATTTTNNTSANSTGSANISSFNNSISYVKTKKDSGNANNPPLLRVDSPKHDTGKYSANILSVYAGANYSLGWNNNGTKEANGITPWGGFAFTHYFSKKISASMGIGYAELDNLDKTYTSNIIQFDFGAATHIITVAPQDAFYLAFPVNFQYNFDSKDRISAGFDYLVLLTTYSTLTTYQQTYFSKTLLGFETENGYTQGFSNYDFQLTLSYTRMITKRFGISLEGYYGLVSVENSSFPGITQYGKNEGGRLVLSYQLLK